MAAAKAEAPLFSFGVITDIQHADIPDGRSFLGIPRYYRHSIEVLRRAVGNWNSLGNLDFAMNFGDIVDGFCPRENSLSAVQRVLVEFGGFRGRVHHMIGNHCLYNLPRGRLTAALEMHSAHYDFSPSREYRVVVLDAYDVSVLGRDPGDQKAREAAKLLRERNPNKDKNDPRGLMGPDRRFVMFNGGVGGEQLRWLDGVLRESAELRQRVIVCSHLPLHPGAASPEALLWNYGEVLDVMHRHGCVKACLAGHDHKGGYAIDSHGVHHRVLEAALECPPGRDAFGHVEVFRDSISLVGVDRMPSTHMLFTSKSEEDQSLG